jgi:hypothetical protein
LELLMVNRRDDARGLVVVKHVHLWLWLKCAAKIGSLGCGSRSRGASNLEPEGELRPLRLAGGRSIRNSFRQFG